MQTGLLGRLVKRYGGYGDAATGSTSLCLFAAGFTVLGVASSLAALALCCAALTLSIASMFAALLGGLLD